MPRANHGTGRAPFSPRLRLAQFLAFILGVMFVSVVIVPVVRSQVPPSGCTSDTGGPCITQCADGTWSSSEGAVACTSHGGAASGVSGPPPSGAPVPAPSGAPVPAPVPLQPATTSSAPVPSAVSAGLIGTGAPPQNIFYVSPEGCDPAPSPAANCGALSVNPSALLCPSTNPCKTIGFALSQAHDGDAIDLAGGSYDIPGQIEVDKLVTIQPNTSATQQVSTTTFVSCVTAGTNLFTCTGTLGVNLLSGSSISITAAGNAPSITSVQVNGAAAGTTPCVLSSQLPAPTATITCNPGQSLPSSTQFIIAVVMTSTPQIATPNVTLTVNAPTISARPVLRSTMGGSIFHVTAVGSAAMHVTIFGLTMGNATSINNSAAIVLDNDSYTEIAHNVIGSQDLPDAIGILLAASDHPIIHDNTIQGSTLFPRTTSIEVGVRGGGFGVVTEECFGSVNHSNGVQLINNLFAKNSNAGIFFCSDGTGGFFVNSNTIRANGRGIVLYDAVDTVISSNTIGDNVVDGIDLLNGSERNVITANIVESQQGNTSIGILLAGNGSFFPLGNQITQNQVRRNTLGIAIVGAQGTQISTNSITAVGTNTGVLFALAIPGWSSGQPLNTALGGNALESTGSCTATNGCTIRLTAGVTVPIDATAANTFGTIDPNAIQAEIWDNGRDPSLGTVYVLAAVPLATPSGILGLPPTPSPASGPPVPITSPTSVPTSGPPVPITSPTPTPTSGPPVPITSPTPTPTSTPSVPPPANGGPGPLSGVPLGRATAYVDPATGFYYVPLLLCVTSAANTPAAGDALTISFFAASGTNLGTASVTADGSGCFNGNVEPGSGSTTPPASLIVSDASGPKFSFNLTVPQAPSRTPTGPIQ